MHAHKYTEQLATILLELLITEDIIVVKNVPAGKAVYASTCDMTGDRIIKHEETTKIGLMTIDIIIRSLEKDNWSDSQKLKLPDGIRNSHKKDYLLTFATSQSISESDLIMGAASHSFFTEHNYPDRNLAMAIVISSSIINPELLQEYHFKQLSPAVYYSNHSLLQYMKIIVLPEVQDKPWNCALNYFSDDVNIRNNAIKYLSNFGVETGSLELGT